MLSEKVNLIMQMGSGRCSGASRKTNKVATLNIQPCTYFNIAQVAVSRLISISVIDYYAISQSAFPPRFNNPS